MSNFCIGSDKLLLQEKNAELMSLLYAHWRWLTLSGEQSMGFLRLISMQVS